MFATLLHSLGLLALPSASLQLSDETAVFSSQPVHSITTDGDTAYVCQGSTVTKMVRLERLVVVDSLPSRNREGWDDAKYVHLGEGMGMVAVVDFPFADTAVWLVDWNRTSRTSLFGPDSRWVTFASLPTKEGFTFAARLGGQANNRYRAAFTSDKGLVQFLYAGTGANRILRMESSLGFDGISHWMGLSLAASALAWDRPLQFRSLVGVPMSGTLADFWQADPAGESISMLAPVSPPLDFAAMDSTAWTGSATVLAAPDGKGWIRIPHQSDMAWLFRLPEPGRREIPSAFPVPGLLSRLGRQWKVPVVAARSDEGRTVLQARPSLAALAGDSSLAVYEWSGGNAPQLLSVASLRHPTRGIAFADTSLWLADRGEIHNWRLRQGTAALRANPRGSDRIRLAWSDGAWTLCGTVGTGLDLVSADGRHVDHLRIGADGRAILPPWTETRYARFDGTVVAVPPLR